MISVVPKRFGEGNLKSLSYTLGWYRMSKDLYSMQDGFIDWKDDRSSTLDFS